MLSVCRGIMLAVASAMALAVVLDDARTQVTSQPPVRLVVIVHPGVDEKSLDIDDLRAVFLRKRLQWSNGQHIVPINQVPNTPCRMMFDATVLGFGSSETARYWVDARIRSGSHPPRSISSEATIAAVVKALPGSIGYVATEYAIAGVRIVARIEAGRVREP